MREGQPVEYGCDLCGSRSHPTEGHPGVAEAKQRSREILESFHIAEGDPVPASVLREIVANNLGDIREGLERNYYKAIKVHLLDKMAQTRREPNFLIRQFRPHKSEKDYIDFIWFMETQAKTNDAYFRQNPEYKLVFTYSMAKEKAEKEFTGYTHDHFTGTDIFQLEKITDGAFPLGDLNPDRRAEFDRLPDLQHSSQTAQASYENVAKFLRDVLKQPEKFPEAEAELERIWANHKFDTVDLEKLKQSFREFGNYEFLLRDGFAMIGQCLVIPRDYNSFVRHQFGIKLKEGELLGSRKWEEGYSMEERAELHAEQGGRSVHFASVYNGQVVIDWTSRQFGNERPVPEVRDLDEHPGLKERIDISE